MNIEEKILKILQDFETFKLTEDEQGVYAKTTSYMPFIDRIKALIIPDVVGRSEQLVCNCQSCGEVKKVEYCEKCYAENLPDIAN